MSSGLIPFGAFGSEGTRNVTIPEVSTDRCSSESARLLITWSTNGAALNLEGRFTFPLNSSLPFFIVYRLATGISLFRVMSPNGRPEYLVPSHPGQLGIRPDGEPDIRPI